MEFVNREEELAFLEKLYKEEAFQFVVLCGRRRVGKTQLVKEFIEGKLPIYFLADSISESEQLKNLGGEVGEFFNDPMKWGQS